MKYSIEEFIKLLRQLPKQDAPSPTFLQILKASHQENLISNLLAFYFDPNEAHGLGDLFLKALFKCLAEIKYSIDESNPIIYDCPEQLNIVRELATDKNNRIDIVLSSGSWVIAVEHKINHKLNNPLQNYQDYIEGKYPNHKRYFLILTPIEKKAEVEGTSFKTILHQRLFHHIREALGQHLPQLAQNNYLFYLLDFIHTMDNEKLETEQEIKLVKAIQNQYDVVLNGYLQLKKVELNIKSRLELLRNQLNIRDYTKSQELWNNDLEKLLYYKLKDWNGNKLLQLKLRLNPKGWRFELWQLRDTYSELPDNVRKTASTHQHPKPDEDFIVVNEFEYWEDIAVIAKEVEDVLNGMYV